MNHTEDKPAVQPQEPRLVLVSGVFSDQAAATRLVEKLIEQDFPMDRISVLHKSGGEGDDMLGLAFTDTGERVRVWGEHGAAWGALWGLLAGAAGLFVLPGVGPLLAAGPVVEALGGAIAGAAVAGGTMAGAALLSELASALHRLGIPDQDIDTLHQAIMDGQIAVILHCSPGEAEQCHSRLAWAGADPVIELPVSH